MYRAPRWTADSRGVSPVVGVALLLVIVVLLVVTFGVMAMGFSEELPEQNPQVAVTFASTNIGQDVTVEYIDGTVSVELNGVEIATLDNDDAGRLLELSVASHDEIRLIADLGQKEVIRQKQISQPEAGDFILYYTFEGQGGTTVVDRSANDNDGTISGATWVTDDQGTGLAFDGTDDFVKVTDLQATNVTTVETFTVAVTYRVDGDTGDIQQLVEHRNDTTNFEWFFETQGNVPYEMEYAVWPNGVTTPGVTTGTMNAGDTHVVVGTYDGDELHLYLDGTYVGSKSVSDSIEMGDLYVGADAVGATTQHLDGRIYQLRLYYTGFTEDEVELLTTVMQKEAE